MKSYRANKKWLYLNGLVNHNQENDYSELTIIDFVSSSGIAQLYLYFDAILLFSLSQDLIHQSFISETESNRNRPFLF